MARVNLEERFFSDPRVRIIAATLKWEEVWVRGALSDFWHATQELLIHEADLQTIENCINLKKKWKKKFIFELISQKFLTFARTENDLEIYKITGNKIQIENRISLVKRASKGGDATKKMWDEVKASSHATSQPTGQLQPSSIQGNSRQGNSNNRATLLSTSVDSPRAVEFLNSWNSNRGSLPGVRELNEERKRKIKTRLTKKPDLDYWAATIKRMAESEFCCTNKFATLDWLIDNDTNHLKVNEGKFDNKKQQSNLKNRGFDPQRAAELEEWAKQEREKFGLD